MHSKYGDRITELWEERRKPGDVEIVVRNAMARELYGALPEEEQARLEMEVDEEFAKAKEEFEAGVDGLEPPSNEDQLE